MSNLPPDKERVKGGLLYFGGCRRSGTARGACCAALNADRAMFAEHSAWDGSHGCSECLAKRRSYAGAVIGASSDATSRAYLPRTHRPRHGVPAHFMRRIACA